jgi:hypothetical protein
MASGGIPFNLFGSSTCLRVGKFSVAQNNRVDQPGRVRRYVSHFIGAAAETKMTSMHTECMNRGTELNLVRER